MMSPQKKATVVASGTAFILAIVKVIAGVLTGSAAVLASAIDSILDMAISVFNFYAVRNSEKESDDLFNYGRGKIEGFASILEGLLIIVSGLFIIYQGTSNIIEGRQLEQMGYATGVMIFSIVMTGGLVWYLSRVGKLTNSLVVQADAIHYKSDLYTNLGVLFSLVVVLFTDWHWVDGVVSIAIAIYIIKEASEVFKEGVLMLMDRALDEETVEAIQEIFGKHKEITSYHYLRTRRSGTVNVVDVHLVFNKNISLWDAHHVSDQVEESIRALDKKAHWMITAHLDPVDDSHGNDLH